IAVESPAGALSSRSRTGPARTTGWTRSSVSIGTMASVTGTPVRRASSAPASSHASRAVNGRAASTTSKSRPAMSSGWSIVAPGSYHCASAPLPGSGWRERAVLGQLAEPGQVLRDLPIRILAEEPGRRGPEHAAGGSIAEHHRDRGARAAAQRSKADRYRVVHARRAGLRGLRTGRRLDRRLRLGRCRLGPRLLGERAPAERRAGLVAHDRRVP